VIVEVPDGVTMEGGVTMGAGVTVALPLPQPAAQITEYRKIAARAPPHAKRLALCATAALQARRLALGAPANFERFLALTASCKIQRFLMAPTKIRASARRRTRRIPGGGTRRPGIETGRTAVPLVVTATVSGAGAPLTIATLAGSWQTAASGAPLQESETVPL
jgi:hypothetical protein